MIGCPSLKRLRLSAHLGYLFRELPLEERFAAARKAGFRTIEIADPYLLSISQFRSLSEENQLSVAQIALQNGVAGAASKGFAALPGHEAKFEQSLVQAIAFAKAVKCPLVHPMSGATTPSEAGQQWDVYLSNLEQACSMANDAGLCVIIEAISASGYFMNSLDRAVSAINQVRAPNLKLSVDSFHGAAMGVHLPSFIQRNGAKIGHVQIGDWPGRDEPGCGEIDFDAIFTALRAARYDGFIGLEYIPSRAHKEWFEWTAAFSNHLEPLVVAPVHRADRSGEEPLH